MDKITQFIASGGLKSLFAVVAAAVVSINVALTALKTFFDFIKDKTVTTWDNKASDFLGKVCHYLGIGVDWMSANKEHVDAPVDPK